MKRTTEQLEKELVELERRVDLLESKPPDAPVVPGEKTWRRKAYPITADAFGRRQVILICEQVVR